METFLQAHDTMTTCSQLGVPWAWKWWQNFYRNVARVIKNSEDVIYKSITQRYDPYLFGKWLLCKYCNSLYLLLQTLHKIKRTDNLNLVLRLILTLHYRMYSQKITKNFTLRLLDESQTNMCVMYIYMKMYSQNPTVLTCLLL